MSVNRAFESWVKTLNEFDSGLQKTGDRCFHIGIAGGCGVDCAAFVDGECGEPQEIPKSEVLEAHGDDAEQIIKLYDCYK